MISSPFIPAFFASNGLAAAASQLADSMFDDTFKGLHHLVFFDWAIMVPYFAVLSVLSVYGLHRYAMIRGYMKHRKQFLAQEPAARFAELAARDHPASDLQRTVRGGAAAGRDHQDRLSAGTAANPGAGRFHRRNASLHGAAGRRISRGRAAHRVYPSRQPARIQGRRAAKTD